MPYTDYANVAAPSNWDQAQSGYLPSQEFYAADPVTGLAYTADETGALRTAALASVWDGTRYDIYELFNTSGFFFKLLVPVEVTEIFVDSYNDYSWPEVVLWDGAGQRLNFNELGITTEEIESLGDGRAVFRFGLQAPIVVSAIAFMGSGGYPQGVPKTVYGVYGTVLAGEPPPPPPFWTGFTKTFEVA